MSRGSHRLCPRGRLRFRVGGSTRHSYHVSFPGTRGRSDSRTDGVAHAPRRGRTRRCAAARHPTRRYLRVSGWRNSRSCRRLTGRLRRLRWSATGCHVLQRGRRRVAGEGCNSSTDRRSSRSCRSREEAPRARTAAHLPPPEPGLGAGGTRGVRFALPRRDRIEVPRWSDRGATSAVHASSATPGVSPLRTRFLHLGASAVPRRQAHRPTRPRCRLHRAESIGLRLVGRPSNQCSRNRHTRPLVRDGSGCRRRLADRRGPCRSLGRLGRRRRVHVSVDRFGHPAKAGALRRTRSTSAIDRADAHNSISSCAPEPKAGASRPQATGGASHETRPA
jgi:hypothetical protein